MMMYFDFSGNFKYFTDKTVFMLDKNLLLIDYILITWNKISSVEQSWKLLRLRL